MTEKANVHGSSTDKPFKCVIEGCGEEFVVTQEMWVKKVATCPKCNTPLNLVPRRTTRQRCR